MSCSSCSSLALKSWLVSFFLSGRGRGLSEGFVDFLGAELAGVVGWMFFLYMATETFRNYSLNECSIK